MVSFFGLKLGADKRKKRAESPPQLPQQWNQPEDYIGRRESNVPLRASISRPRTSQATHGPRGLYSGDTSHQDDADFKGIRAVLLGTTAAVPAGTGPVLSPTLKTFSSDSNLRVSLGTRNLSSTSLNMPPNRLGRKGSSELAPRPTTAHSMRGSGTQRPSLHLNPPSASMSAFGAAPRSPLGSDESASSPLQCDKESSLGMVRASSANQRPTLHTDLPNMSTTTFGGTPKSPLGQYELTSPVTSETESLLGGDPGKIADEIAARIALEEQRAAAQVSEDRRRLEAELEEQKGKLDAARKKLETARLRMACPSPPASIESEQGIPGHERKASTGLQVPALTPSRPASGQSKLLTPSHVDATRSSSSSLLPTIDLAPPPRQSAPTTTAGDTTPATGPRERSNTDGQLSLDSQRLRPQQHPREHLRGATVPGANAPRSPLFQQLSPFDIHSDDDEDEDDEEDKAKAREVDHRATNAPYGLPSPPLSHRQRPSKEDEDEDEDEDEGVPVLRTVHAKRDTTLVGGPGRRSLGLQIDEFEKSLQQAQAMSALESCEPKIAMAQRHRASSNASSTYSDSEASPVVIDPPFISPKPFPLSPRPMGRQAPHLLEVRPASPFGDDFFSSFAKQTANLLPTKAEAEKSSAAPSARPRPRLGAVKPSQESPKPIKVNTVAALAGRRVRRPNLEEYGVPLSRAASPFDLEDSPVLKDVRHAISPNSEEDMMDGFSSTDTSCTTSPIAAVASYSVFSPPPPQPQVTKRPMPPRSAKPEWFGPAPSAPPTSPLPIPERSAMRRNPITPHQQTPPPPPGQQQQQHYQQQPALAPSTPGLRTSPSIVPDMDSNPNWPLPGPTGLASPPERGFTARRSLHRDRRAPPAPINIMATKYADEVGAKGGPWTPDAGHARTTGPDLSGWKEEPAPYQQEVMLSEGDKIGGIGVARGLSIKYDKIRERERRVRAHDRMKRMAIVTVAEDVDVVAAPAPAPVTPTMSEPFERRRRPDHGLKSPMGFADEQGIGFI